MFRKIWEVIITKIACTACDKVYELRAWDTIPEKCTQCGVKRDEVLSWDLPF